MTGPGGRAEDAGHTLEVAGVEVDDVVTDPVVPAVTHGRFTVRNRAPEARRIAVSGVRVRFPGTTADVGDVFVYRLPEYDEVRTDAIEVAAGHLESFEVSFAAVPLDVGLANDVAVEVELASGDGTVVVVSPWTGTVRTPRR